jgi:hypothetical protein
MLHFASYKGNAPTVDCLLRKGFDPNKDTDEGLTALHLATIRSHDSVVTALINGGANVEIPNRDCWSPFYMAAYYANNYAIGLSLRNHGANAESEAKDGTTAIHAAVQSKNNEMTAFLVSNILGGINWRERSGFKPFFQGVSGQDDIAGYNGYAALRWLIESGDEKTWKDYFNPSTMAARRAKRIFDSDGWNLELIASQSQHEFAKKSLEDVHSDLSNSETILLPKFLQLPVLWTIGDDLIGKVAQIGAGGKDLRSEG